MAGSGATWYPCWPMSDAHTPRLLDGKDLAQRVLDETLARWLR